jgi:CheY-like chemotaxis protein
MDMQMPVMDGITAARLIRRNPKYDKLPVVPMTANAMQSDRDRCAAAGMTGFVGKPFDPDELWRALLTHIPVRRTLPDSVLSASPRITKENSALPEGLHQIAGLDVTLGLRRVMGNQPLYLNLLRSFCSGQAQAIHKVQQALRAGDRQTAERIAHTLKSLAGNIGAIALQASAEQLEAKIASSENNLYTQMQQCEVLLDQLCANLRPHVSQITTHESQDGMDPKVVLKRLEELLKDDDAEALDFWQTHASLLQVSLKENHASVGAAIEQYEFQTAYLAIKGM